MGQTRRELIEAAFQNQPVDRVPVGFWHHFLPSPRIDGFGHPELREKVLAGQQAFYEAFQPDVIKIMTDGFFGYPHPLLGRKLVSVKDILSIQPIGKHSAWYEEQIAYAKELVRRYGREVPLFYNLFTPYRVFTFSQGTEKEPFDLVPWIKEEPEALNKVLDVVAGDYALLAEGLIREAGVDGIYLSVNSVDYDRVTESEYDAVIRPGEIKVLEAADEAGGREILHICGYQGFRNHLEWYKDYPAAVVNWAANTEHVSLSAGKKLFGGRAVLGGFGQTNQDLIYTGTREELQKETVRLLQEAGTTGVILGADCTVPPDTDPRHFEWVREAAEAFGK